MIENDVYVSPYYDPHLLPDYSGSLFHHQAVKLMQHDIRDIDLHLIPPWQFYDKLHAGTMVLCTVSLHMYQMAIPSTLPHQPKIRKVKEFLLYINSPLNIILYQLLQLFKLNAEYIRIVTRSDLPIKTQHQLILLTGPSTSSTTQTHQSQDTESDPCLLFNVVNQNTVFV